MLTSTRTACLAIVTSLFAAMALAAPGDLDPGYGNAGQLSVPPGWRFAATPDGRVVQWQVASGAGGVTVQLRRYLANGQLDAAWGAGGEVALDPSAFLAAQGKSLCVEDMGSSGRAASDGTTVLLLNLAANPSTSCIVQVVVKLLPNGAPDTTFGSAGYVNFSSALAEPQYFDHDLIGPQDDGSVLAGQYWYGDYGMQLGPLRRIRADGSISPAINESTNNFIDGYLAKVRGLADGRIVVADVSGIHVLKADLTRDPSYGSAGSGSFEVTAPAISSAIASAAGTSDLKGLVVGDAVITSDGSVVISLVAASHTTTNNKMMLARISASGQLDTNFGTGGVAVLDTAGAPWSNLAFGAGSLSHLVMSTTGELTVQGYVESAEAAARHVAYGFLWRRTAQGQAPSTPALAGIQVFNETPLWGCCINGVTLLAAQSAYDVLMTNSSATGIVRLGTDVGASAGLITLTRFRTVDEGATARFAAWRTAGSDGAVSLSYSTSSAGIPLPLTATAGSDYVVTSGRIDWADGESGVKYIDITTLANPQLASDAQLRLNVAKVSGDALLMNYPLVAVNIHNTAPLPPGTPSTPVSGSASSSSSGGGAVGGWMLALLLGLTLASRWQRPARC